MLIKRKPLEFVKAFAAKSENRFVLNGVFIEHDKMTATDGKILGQISQQKDLTAKDYPKVEGIDPGQSEQPLNPVIVPNDGVEALIRAIPKKKGVLPILQTAIVNTVQTNGGSLFIAGTTDLETTTPINVRKIDGQYPNTEQVIPQSDVTTLFHIDPSLMARAMTAATKLGLTLLQFAQKPDSPLSPIKITGQTEDGEVVTIIVMPLRCDKK